MDLRGLQDIPRRRGGAALRACGGQAARGAAPFSRQIQDLEEELGFKLFE